MKNKQLFFEQEATLASRLRSAGIEHGDTADLTVVGVGVSTKNSGERILAFCPITITMVRMVRKGSTKERSLPMPTIVCASNNLRNRIYHRGPDHGFVKLRLRVHSNGVIQLNGRVTKSEPVQNACPVTFTDSYNEFRELCSSAGQ